MKATLCAFLMPLLVLAQGEPPRPQFQQGKADPGAPVPDPAAAAQRIKKLDDNNYQLGEIKFNAKTREVRMPTVLNMREGSIEYACVHESGKTHEALLRTTASAIDLQVAMLLTNYQPGHTGLFDYVADPVLRKRRESTAPQTPGANFVRLELEWLVDGKPVRKPLTDCLIVNPEKKPPADLPYFVFNGSMIQASGFSAEVLGSSIGLYYDVTAVINCPGARNDLDDVWQPNTSILPGNDTPVTVIITPHIAPKP